MNQWDYVMVVYAIAILGTLALIGFCHISLKGTEKRLEDIKRK
ncbi:hypothetical protein [Sphingorhabdus sp. Alg239-R122]|nr:hypothetical protein [Sphingorhabdus sp. Alg239-R122]